MLSHIKKRMKQWPNLLIVFGILFLLTNCEKDTKISFTADFSYEFIDDNHVKIVNLSEGEYYSLDWDFANGETVTSTDKSKTYTIYYPEAGEYNVTLSVLDFTGNKMLSSKTISITKSDFILSFSANVVAENPNYLALGNTSVGNYDSFKWIYDNKIVENEINTLAYFPSSRKIRN